MGIILPEHILKYAGNNSFHAITDRLAYMDTMIGTIKLRFIPTYMPTEGSINDMTVTNTFLNRIMRLVLSGRNEGRIVVVGCDFNTGIGAASPHELNMRFS